MSGRIEGTTRPAASLNLSRVAQIGAPLLHSPRPGKFTDNAGQGSEEGLLDRDAAGVQPLGKRRRDDQEFRQLQGLPHAAPEPFPALKPCRSGSSKSSGCTIIHLAPSRGISFGFRIATLQTFIARGSVPDPSLRSSRPPSLHTPISGLPVREVTRHMIQGGTPLKKELRLL